MERERDTWEYDNNNVKYQEPEKYEGTVDLGRHQADCWEPPENGSDFSGTLQSSSVKYDVDDELATGTIAGESDTDCRRKDRGGDTEPNQDNSSLNHVSFPAVPVDETLLVEPVDSLKNVPTYTDGIGSRDQQLGTCNNNQEKWNKTGDLYQGTGLKKCSNEERSLLAKNVETGGVLWGSSAPNAVFENLHVLLAMLNLKQSNKVTSVSAYKIINTEVLDKKDKTWQDEEVISEIKQIITAAELGPGAQMVCVFACLLFGLQCFHSILKQMLWDVRQLLPKQTARLSHRQSIMKGLMPSSRKESTVTLYKSVTPPAPTDVLVYMMRYHGKDNNMLRDHQQRSTIQADAAVNLAPPSLPDGTDVAYTGDESDSPDPTEENPMTSSEHKETLLSRSREDGCSYLSPFQISRDNIHFTGNRKKPGNTVNLHGSRERRKGELTYGTNAQYIAKFLQQRGTPDRMRGVLRDPSLHNMTTEEGFQMDQHYKRWKELAEDECGRMTVCRARNNNTVFTFLMIERDSLSFREEELQFYLEYGGKVHIVPRLLGVIEEDGYVKLMFPFTPGHEVLSTVLDAGNCFCNRKFLLLFLEQLARGIKALHKHGVILGGLHDHMVLLNSELDSSGIYLFPSRSVRTMDNTEYSTKQPLIGADSLTLVETMDKATDMLSFGQLLQRLLSRLQNPDTLVTQLMVELLEPDVEVRITASEAVKHPLFEQRRCLSIERCEDVPIV